MDLLPLIETALRVSTPLLFAALAGVLSERVGVVNIALEGKLLAGAFAAMAVAHLTGQPWLGIAAAGTCGLLIALFHALLVLGLRVDAIISGVALNLMAWGATTFLLRAFFQKQGTGVHVEAPGAWLPALAGVPVLRMLLGGVTPFVPMALAAAGTVWFLMYRTLPGLQMRAVGEGPAAARAAGIPVNRVRVLWLAAAGFLAGLGGAYLSLDIRGFTENLSAGRGYLALAAVIFGRWHPLGAAGAVLFFALGEALQIQLQGRVRVSSELMSALPYLLGLLALAGLLGRARPPAGLGQAQ